jgi:hypothetical protein
MKKRDEYTIGSIILLSFIISLLSGCGGGSGGGEGPAPGPSETSWVAGTWETSANVHNVCPTFSEDRVDDGTFKISQDGSSITVTDKYNNTFSGSVNGNKVSWSGSFPDPYYGGTTTYSSLDLTVNGDSLSGTVSYTWTDGQTQCSGTAQISGNRTVITPKPDDNPDDDSNDSAQEAVFPGYDFALAEGSFWEFGFDDYSHSWYLGDNNTSRSRGIFRITLGAPVTIEGITAYPLNVTPVSGDDIADTLTFQWSYMALDGGRILGSKDGATLSVIFDAFKGVQAGGGFFASFASDSLVRAESGQIDNDYIKANAAYLEKAASSGGCEYFPDIGDVCPGEDREGLTVRDYFQADIGPAGYYYYSYNSDSQGNSGASKEINIGLLTFSVKGDGFYDPPQVPRLNSGTVAIYYSLYKNPPSVVVDPYNAPTPVDPSYVLMRYLPESQESTALTAQLSEEADYGYHALTQGDRLFILKRMDSNNTIQALEYDPVSHSPLDTTATSFNNAGSKIQFGALTVAADAFYFQEYSPSAVPATAPWAETYPLYRQLIGLSSKSNLGSSVGYNHLLSDGSDGNSPFAASISNDSMGICDLGSYSYYFFRIDVRSGIDPVFLDGACESATYFSDLPRLVHSFAMDTEGLYIARSNGGAIETYRINRSNSNLQQIYSDNFGNQRRALIIDASKGYVLLHSFDRDNLSDYEVVLLDTKNTSAIEDDTREVITLPGNGIPMNLQIIVAP